MRIETTTHRGRPGILLGLALLVTVSCQPNTAQDAAACLSDCDCETGSICSTEGRCEVAICTKEFRPVCGVDHKTYGNACEARAARVVVAHEGKCEGAKAGPTAGRRPEMRDVAAEGETCGTIAGIGCEEGLWCDFEEGMCQGADMAGTCVRPREECPPEEQPVCGCDGTTYEGDCERIRARVQKDHPGPCD